jgi:hypothetical protein
MMSANKNVPEITGETSDGYHTFNELYEHRHTLFAIVLRSHPQSAWKTWREQNGEIWEGWFIAGLNTEFGQVSYHLPAEWWERLPDVREIERNSGYDGHTSADVLERLRLIVEGPGGFS